MKSLLIRLGVSVVALWLTSLLAQHLGIALKISGAGGAFLAVLALSLANALIRPIISLLSLPARMTTFNFLGLYGILVNAVLFLAVGLARIPGFQVGVPGKPLETLKAAFFGSIVMGVVSGILNAFVKPRRR